MERLARSGIRFTDAHSPSNRCMPSRYALMAGRYCWRTRLKHWVLFGHHTPPLIKQERITMPEVTPYHTPWTQLVEWLSPSLITVLAPMALG